MLGLITSHVSIYDISITYATTLSLLNHSVRFNLLGAKFRKSYCINLAVRYLLIIVFRPFLPIFVYLLYHRQENQQR